MMPLLWLLVVANGVGYATLIAGWWIVAPVALVAAVAAPRGSRPLLSLPLGAALGWAALLARSARAANFETLTAALAKLLPLSVSFLAAITILLPLLIALGAALLVGALRKGTQS